MISDDEAFRSERSFATTQETELILALRKELETELASLAAEGNDFPHTTGDIFLLRVIRGSAGDVDQAAAWYRTCLQTRKQYGMDALFKKIRELPFDFTRLPGHDEVCKYIKMLGNEVSLTTPRGDLIQCDFVGGVSWRKFMSEVGVDKYVDWQICVQEAKLVALDRLSRERGHLVKYVALVDFRDFRLPPREFMKMETKIKTGICELTGIEIVHRILFLSVPRVFYRVWEMATPLLPERTRRNIQLLDKNFMQHPAAVAEAGAALLAKISAARSIEASESMEDDVLQGSLRVIFAGSTFEKGVPVAIGQRVRWRFRVGGADELAAAGPKTRGSLGGLLDRVKDATDVDFDVVAMWDLEAAGDHNSSIDPAVGGVETLFSTVERVKRISSSDEEVCGSLLAERSGIIMLRWSNEHSWVRSKVLASFEISVDSGENPTT